jgi:TonB family protein
MRLAFVGLLMVVLMPAGFPQEPPPVVIKQSVPITDRKPAKKSDEPPPCPTKFEDSLETNGIAAKIGGQSGVVPPKPVHTVEAEMTDQARRLHKDKKIADDGFKSVISIVVDKEGLPTQVCLKTAAGYGLDAEAGKAVRQYRFEPAMKDDLPVAARLNIEIRFRFY